MNDSECRDCQHYIQHYGIDEKQIFALFCGHCTYMRAKHKRPNTRACEHFTPAAPVEDSFVSKEYLSKALLEYMLRLDLFPKIQDPPERE